MHTLTDGHGDHRLEELAWKYVNEYQMPYHVAADKINRECGVTVSDDWVRYHSYRKFKKKVDIREQQKQEGVTKKLVFSDLHIPFHREDIIFDIIKKHRHEIDEIVFSGDIIDCASVSSFPEESRPGLAQELAITHRFMRKVGRLTPGIKKTLLEGNHEQRLKMYLAKNPSAINPFVSSHPLDILVGGFEIHDKLNKVKKKFLPLPDDFVASKKWYIQIGDTIICHPRTFRKGILKTAEVAVQYFINHGFHFNVLWCAHTHKWGEYRGNGKLIGELGCLCHEFDYSSSGNLNYGPQEYGCLLMVQKDGKYDKEASIHYHFDVEDGEAEWVESVDEDPEE